MSDALRIRGVVVGHGAMAQGLVDAVRHIAGDAAADLVAVSNEGRGPKQLTAALEEAAGEGPVVVFTDLRSGSCGVAATYSCRDRDRRAVICGVNLPMLLDFVFNRDQPLRDLVERLVEKGREAIVSTPVTGP
jgi:mannose/fructose-specific phosphotransferase system component IIA